MKTMMSMVMKLSIFIHLIKIRIKCYAEYEYKNLRIHVAHIITNKNYIIDKN